MKNFTKLKEGSWYLDANGQILGPIIDTKDGSSLPFTDKKTSRWFSEKGMIHEGGCPTTEDLITEIEPPVIVHKPMPKTKKSTRVIVGYYKGRDGDYKVDTRRLDLTDDYWTLLDTKEITFEWEE